MQFLTDFRAPQSFFDKTDTGTTLNRFSQDMTLVETSLALGVLFTVFSELPNFHCLRLI
jgi:hypothetical protein